MPLNGNLFQQELIMHGACTLAKMKTGSLFRIIKTKIPNVQECTRYFHDLCSPFGYRFTFLKETKQDVLVFVYHEQKLQNMLANAPIQNFLDMFGYTHFDIDPCIQHLRDRLRANEFPHEIGVFLGYPLQDVRAFLDPNAQCLLVGRWRVYGNAKNMQKIFYRYDCLTKTMETKVSMGEPFVDILKQLN